MPNVVFVVGLGPGDPRFLTAQAQSALTQAEVLCGYTVYLDLVRPYFPDKLYYSTGMTKEIDRCRWALETARSGRAVALVCSGAVSYTHLDVYKRQHHRGNGHQCQRCGGGPDRGKNTARGPGSFPGVVIAFLR